jgi:hypothetical protein
MKYISILLILTLVLLSCGKSGSTTCPATKDEENKWKTNTTKIEENNIWEQKEQGTCSVTLDTEGAIAIETIKTSVISGSPSLFARIAETATVSIFLAIGTYVVYGCYDLVYIWFPRVREIAGRQLNG